MVGDLWHSSMLELALHPLYLMCISMISVLLWKTFSLLVGPPNIGHLPQMDINKVNNKHLNFNHNIKNVFIWSYNINVNYAPLLMDTTTTKIAFLISDHKKIQKSFRTKDKEDKHKRPPINQNSWRLSSTPHQIL
jgi:hypothetical protein